MTPKIATPNRAKRLGFEFDSEALGHKEKAKPRTKLDFAKDESHRAADDFFKRCDGCLEKRKVGPKMDAKTSQVKQRSIVGSAKVHDEGKAIIAERI